MICDLLIILTMAAGSLLFYANGLVAWRDGLKGGILFLDHLVKQIPFHPASSFSELEVIAAFVTLFLGILVWALYKEKYLVWFTPMCIVMSLLWDIIKIFTPKAVDSILADLMVGYTFAWGGVFIFLVVTVPRLLIRLIKAHGKPIITEKAAFMHPVFVSVTLTTLIYAFVMNYFQGTPYTEGMFANGMIFWVYRGILTYIIMGSGIFCIIGMGYIPSLICVMIFAYLHLHMTLPIELGFFNLFNKVDLPDTSVLCVAFLVTGVLYGWPIINGIVGAVTTLICGLMASGILSGPFLVTVFDTYSTWMVILGYVFVLLPMIFIWYLGAFSILARAGDSEYLGKNRHLVWGRTSCLKMDLYHS